MTKFLQVSQAIGSMYINESVADQVINAADTYVTGSSLQLSKVDQIPRTRMRWTLWMTKTAAGVAAPTFNIRAGALGTVADVARLAFVGPAQTAAVDAAIVRIETLIRVDGALGVVVGSLAMLHNGNAAGFAVIPTPVLNVVSAAFDVELPNEMFGLSINPGAAGVWTVQACISELSHT